jgi:PleD family two-component response regulator
MSKILLVEDDELESRLYINLFSKSGFEVVAIPNGEQCHTKAVEVQPDIIVLDIMMPKMNGFETLDVLHFDPDTAKIPIIILTNLSDDHYKTESLKRGATLFLTKSNIDNTVLIQQISDIVRAYSEVKSV